MRSGVDTERCYRGKQPETAEGAENETNLCALGTLHSCLGTYSYLESLRLSVLGG